MRVVAEKDNFNGCPSEFIKLGYTSDSQTEISCGKEYEVWAVVSWQNFIFFQIINDLEFPVWLPAWLFKIIDKMMPADWICSVFEDEPKLIIGPMFIAENYKLYERMVELHPESVESFWSRVRALERERFCKISEQSI